MHHDGDPEKLAGNVNPLEPSEDRMVITLVDPTITGINECRTHMTLSLSSPLDALLATNSHTIMGKRDLSRGCYHTVLHADSSLFMGFRDPLTHCSGHWVGLPFGAAQSPAVLCEVTEVISNHVIVQAGVVAMTMVYVDSIFVLADSHLQLRYAFQLMDTDADLFGLSFNPGKSVGLDLPLSHSEVHVC